MLDVQAVCIFVQRYFQGLVIQQYIISHTDILLQILVLQLYNTCEVEDAEVVQVHLQFAFNSLVLKTLNPNGNIYNVSETKY